MQRLIIFLFLLCVCFQQLYAQQVNSNRGTEFFVGYGHNQLFSTNSQDMVLYLSAEQAATVRVTMVGSPFVQTYNVPANSVVTTTPLPKAGLIDARLLIEGLQNKGILITSDVPIVVYAHCYGSASSGATMLLPTSSYGYEYYSLNTSQVYASDCFSWFYVVANENNTRVEITPSAATRGGRNANVPFQVTLNRGQIFQVLGAIQSGSTGFDLTGSRVRSIPNSAGECKPFAMFSGSSRTAICNTTNGDYMIQQVFPYTAWGRRYLTFNTATSTSASQFNPNTFRVMVRDANTVVRRNGVIIPPSSLVANRYYQFTATTGQYITADKPILVSQILPSTSGTAACAGGSIVGNGDPEMIYLSPLEQAIDRIGFFNTALQAITRNYVNIIVPTAGLSSLLIDGSNTFNHSFPHPALAGYTCVVKITTPGQHIVTCDSAFTSITYGLGNVESYGYNAGTLIKDLSFTSSFNNQNSSLSVDSSTCIGIPFGFRLTTSYRLTGIRFKPSLINNVTPSTDTLVSNPPIIDSIEVDGVMFYRYSLPISYTFSQIGSYQFPIDLISPLIENCNNLQTIRARVIVTDRPYSNFSINTTGCTNSPVQFTATPNTNGFNINRYNWNLGNATTSTQQNPTVNYTAGGTYNVNLRITALNGCTGDTTRSFTLATILAPVNVVWDSIASGVNTVRFSWQSVAGAVSYQVSIDNGITFTTPSSGATGLEHIVTGLAPDRTINIIVRAVGTLNCQQSQGTAVGKTRFPDVGLFIPNAFTPNGDGRNDRFTVYGNYIKSVKLMIFNQWGEKLFEGNNLQGWDGTYKGIKQPIGVYVYVAEVLFENGNRYHKKGSINLVR
jgi:gliding motility-associated-like protein